MTCDEPEHLLAYLRSSASLGLLVDDTSLPSHESLVIGAASPSIPLLFAQTNPHNSLKVTLHHIRTYVVHV